MTYLQNVPWQDLPQIAADTGYWFMNRKTSWKYKNTDPITALNFSRYNLNSRETEVSDQFLKEFVNGYGGGVSIFKYSYDSMTTGLNLYVYSYTEGNVTKNVVLGVDDSSPIVNPDNVWVLQPNRLVRADIKKQISNMGKTGLPIKTMDDIIGEYVFDIMYILDDIKKTKNFNTVKSMSNKKLIHSYIKAL